jgi:hypothetical protein
MRRSLGRCLRPADAVSRVLALSTGAAVPSADAAGQRVKEPLTPTQELR